jgi:TusA-related sulfurtransferase
LHRKLAKPHSELQIDLHRERSPLKAFCMSMEAPVEVLDVRGMAAPSNVLSILKRASELPNGASLQIRSDTNPWQLYDLLQQRGYTLLIDRQKDGSFAGVVRPRETVTGQH